MGDVSSKIMVQFADNLNEMLDQDVLSASPNGDDPGDGIVDEILENGPESNGGSDEQSATGDDAPQVRKIDGPAKDPIDLMEVGGGSVVKRAAPALLALLILILILRRRRS